MRQGIQTGFKLQELRTHGCYFFTLCEFAERLREKQGISEFTDDEIIEAYMHGLKEKWITTGMRDFNGRKAKVTCFIENPVAIMNHLQSQTVFRSISHELNQPNAEFYPVFYTGTPDHFALGSNGKIIFDSWSPSAESRGMKLASTNPFRWLR
jgi:hypothetical protein